jgi:hypothetical protein
MSKLIEWPTPNSRFPIGDVPKILPGIASAIQRARDETARLNAELAEKEKAATERWRNMPGLDRTAQNAARDAEITEARKTYQAKKVAAIDAANKAIEGNRKGLALAHAEFAHKGLHIETITPLNRMADVAALCAIYERKGPTELREQARRDAAASGDGANVEELLVRALAMQTVVRRMSVKDRPFSLDEYHDALSLPSYDEKRKALIETARDLAAFDREAADIARTGTVSSRTRISNALDAGALHQRGPTEESSLSADTPTGKIAAGLRAKQAAEDLI